MPIGQAPAQALAYRGGAGASEGSEGPLAWPAVSRKAKNSGVWGSAPGPAEGGLSFDHVGRCG
jgi:hypothetical protein